MTRLGETPGASRSALVDEAARRFDLSPLEAERLIRLLADPSRPRPAGDPAPPE